MKIYAFGVPANIWACNSGGPISASPIASVIGPRCKRPGRPPLSCSSRPYSIPDIERYGSPCCDAGRPSLISRMWANRS